MNFKRNMKAAFTTVKSNFKEYICFIIALLMVQMLFCTLVISLYNNETVEREKLHEAGFDYHVSFENLEAADLEILSKLYTYHESQKSRTFEYAPMSENGVVRSVHIVFTGSYRNTYQIFQNALMQMNDGYDHASLETTPLYEFDASFGSVFASLFPLLILLSVVSFFLLTALFRIRLNHFKFTYAVYMTFGANFKKLFSAAFFEMLLLVFVTYPFSIALSYLAAALLYLPQSAPFGFYFVSLPLTLFFSLLCALLSLILPIKLLSRSAPVRLFKAEDNSNLVSSPRRSAKFLGKSAAYIELRGLWRFRRHIAVLLLSTVSFAVLFLLGMYLADAYTVRTGVKTPDFEATAENETVFDHLTGVFRNEAEKRGADAYLEKAAADPYAAGGAREGKPLPNLALNKKQIASPAFTESAADENYAATEALEIRAFDGDALKCFDSIYGYTYKGDPARALTDPETVIVSSSLAGVKALNVEPGDVIYLSTDYVPLPDASLPDADLRSFGLLMESGVYTYRAFTVAAVIDNYTDYDNMLVYLPTCETKELKSPYEAVMGQKASFTALRVYVSDVEGESVAAWILRTYLSQYGGITYTRSYSQIEASIDRAKNHEGMIGLLSVFVLVISPLAGIFSQILFYGKRKQEFDVIRAVGGTKKQLRAIFITDGAALMALSGAVYTGLSFLAVKAASAFLNSRYAFMFSSDRSRAAAFSSEMPLVPFFIGLGLTVLFAGAAVLLPALLYKRAAGAHISADLEKDDG